MTLTHSLKALIRDLPGIGPAVTQLRLMTLSPSDRRAYEQNIRYDRETLLVMERVLQPDSNAVDVGAHRGAILSAMVRLSPNGRHLACEPIAAMAADLRRRFASVEVHQVAVGAATGTASFTHIRNRPAHSGLQPRLYDLPEADVETVTVPVKRLDEIVPGERRVAFVKVDVEGGDLNVLRGGLQMIRRSQPVIVFEAGQKAAGLYGIAGSDIYDFVSSAIEYSLSTMERWLQGEPPYSRDEFLAVWDSGSDYYFIACPAGRTH